MATTTPTPSRRSSATSSLSPITPTTSTRPSSSPSTKSPGSSPRSPLLLSMCNTEPAALSLNDDPTLDLDFDLLFLHDDAASKRPTAHRVKSSFTEHRDASSRAKSANIRSSPTRRDWSTFTFSHYPSETGYGGAVGLRGKGRMAELYTRNKVEMQK